MKIAFATLGCKVNQYETQALKEMFRNRGNEIVEENEPADVCIVNTCSVTNMADRKSRQTIRHFRKLNPECIIAVTGCYAQTGSEKLKEMEEVNILAGTNEKSSLPELVEQFIQERDAIYRIREYSDLADFDEMGEVEAMEGRTRAYIKIQEGCNRFCSYCIIPFARGNVRSRDEDVIVREAQHLIEKGYKEIVLTGINTALYGSEEDGEPKLHVLLERMSEIPGEFRIRMSSLEPTVINADYIKKLFKFDRLCHHVHLSVQSGSDEILKKMNRRYNMDEYREIVDAIKGFDPEYGISTDIIVGFPEESEENFEDSVRITEEAGFCKVHVFKYSERNGTKAAVMKNQIAPQIKNERSEKLMRKAEEAAASFIERNVGKQRKVLFEEYHEDLGMVSGLTDNYIRVYVEADNDEKSRMINSIKNVLLENRFLDGIKGVLL